MRTFLNNCFHYRIMLKVSEKLMNVTHQDSNPRDRSWKHSHLFSHNCHEKKWFNNHYILYFIFTLMFLHSYLFLYLHLHSVCIITPLLIMTSYILQYFIHNVYINIHMFIFTFICNSITTFCFILLLISNIYQAFLYKTTLNEGVLL